ncbi:putative HTH-type transcriptional regulator YdfH [Rhodobacteraceae bacterium THAF1]|uniref:GntR family transcriptional regulator n=1 Tax=Palleronia sp. THAF1 TaxID=2587842 RepID=UPI000F401490|nr:GntR family transcriptional regulator [Palleronia sp. THAF1]QFU08838.1 putative HTH-type transcriptional regulator YdfH [Palleronia sp. THAF1]VDC23973.1 putative HTH-type transcriptional regulator YdfH [Rhodobacteraceae bacterium THAF1]
MLKERDSSGAEIDLARPIAPQLRSILRRRIVRNLLKPDQKISESEIAAQFGVSRQPVREAFIRLADDGLLSILPQRATRIRRIDIAEVREARFIRESVESDIVQVLAQSSDAATVAKLRDLVDQQNRIDAGDPVAFMVADEAFHRELANSAAKFGIWRKLHGLKTQMDRVRFLSLEQFPIAKLVEQHADIVDGISKGDLGAAEAALRTHLREVLADLPLIAHRNPDFFDAIPDGAEDRVVILHGGETEWLL